jgi:hypothetical protein
MRRREFNGGVADEAKRYFVALSRRKAVSEQDGILIIGASEKLNYSVMPQESQKKWYNSCPQPPGRQRTRDKMLFS